MNEFARSAHTVIDFKSPWAFDHRDRRGLPVLPMRKVKGTLRETAERLAEAGVPGISADRLQLLFGGWTAHAGAGELAPAALSWAEDAVIADEMDANLTEHKDALSQRFASTALNEDGVARDRTLRTIEVAVPVVLIGRIQWSAATPPDFGWIDCLDRICAATPRFGLRDFYRSGYGLASARIEGNVGAAANSGDDV